MSWVAINVTQFIGEGFNTDERTTLQDVAGGDDGLTNILSAAIAEWRGVIEAAGFDLDADTTTIPPSCRRYIIAQVRWQLLVKFSQLKQLQTEERKAEAEKAEDVLTAIAEGKRAIEAAEEDDSDIPAGGNWGSETKVDMRTHQTPSEE